MSDEEFEVAESGASGTFPTQAGSLRKGAYVMIKDRPCKIAEVTTSKPGKHGHAKANIVAIDIFNNKKYEDCCPTSHNMNVPNVSRVEYSLMDITEEGYLSLMDENGNVKEDLKLPIEMEPELCEKIQKMFNEGKQVLVGTIGALGFEMVNAVKEDTT